MSTEDGTARCWEPLRAVIQKQPPCPAAPASPTASSSDDVLDGFVDRILAREKTIQTAKAASPKRQQGTVSCSDELFQPGGAAGIDALRDDDERWCDKLSRQLYNLPSREKLSPEQCLDITLRAPTLLRHRRLCDQLCSRVPETSVALEVGEIPTGEFRCPTRVVQVRGRRGWWRTVTQPERIPDADKQGRLIRWVSTMQETWLAALLRNWVQGTLSVGVPGGEELEFPVRVGPIGAACVTAAPRPWLEALFNVAPLPFGSLGVEPANPWALAAYSGSASLVDCLVERSREKGGGYPDGQCPVRLLSPASNPLHDTASAGKDAKGRELNDALHVAAEYGHARVVQPLVDAGASPTEPGQLPHNAHFDAHDVALMSIRRAKAMRVRRKAKDKRKSKAETSPDSDADGARKQSLPGRAVRRLSRAAGTVGSMAVNVGATLLLGITKEPDKEEKEVVEAVVEAFHELDAVNKKLRSIAWPIFLRRSILYFAFVASVSWLVYDAAGYRGHATDTPNWAAHATRSAVRSVQVPQSGGEDHNNEFADVDDWDDIVAWLKTGFASDIALIDSPPVFGYRQVGSMRVAVRNARVVECTHRVYNQVLRDEGQECHAVRVAHKGHSERYTLEYHSLRNEQYTLEPHQYRDIAFQPDLEGARAAMRNATANVTTGRGTEPWPGRAARLIWLHFTLYNPNSDVFVVTEIYFELPAAGGVYPYERVTPVRLQQDSWFAWIIIVLYLLQLVLLECSALVLLVQGELRALATAVNKEEEAQGTEGQRTPGTWVRYVFRGLAVVVRCFASWLQTRWNVLNIVSCVLQLLAVMWSVRIEGRKQDLRDDPGLLTLPLHTPLCGDFPVAGEGAPWMDPCHHYDDFAVLANWQRTRMMYIGWVALIAWLYVCHQLQYAPQIGPVIHGIVRALFTADVLAFFLLLLIILAGLIFFFITTFGPYDLSMQNGFPVVLTVVQMSLGDWDLETLERAYPLQGRLIFLFAVLFIHLVFLNILIPVISEAYTKAKETYGERTWGMGVARAYTSMALLPRYVSVGGRLLDALYRKCRCRRLRPMEYINHRRPGSSDADVGPNCTVTFIVDPNPESERPLLRNISPWVGESTVALHQKGEYVHDEDTDKVVRELRRAVQPMFEEIRSKLADLMTVSSAKDTQAVLSSLH